jgi:preprotein translocase subunit SecF
MNWMKYRLLYFAISLLVIIPGVFSLFRYGLKLSIEFTGGSILELKQVNLDENTIKDKLSSYEIISINQDDKDLKIQLKPITQEQADSIIKNLSVNDSQPELINFETIGPVLGQETLKKTITAIIIASCLILFFIARAFKEIKYGVCAVIAMFHDSLVLLGIFSLLGHFFGFETDLLFVTAVLTTLSFSVHDTIVVYDRIRELSRRLSGSDFESIANCATTETMVRSLSNSLTIIFMLLALVLMGGQTTKGFALALLVGTISGTYSSPFTATPLLVVWDKISKKKN